MKHRIILIVIAVIVLLIVAALLEIIFIKQNGGPLPAPAIPRGVQTLGSGPALTYVVMGDSTSIGQGTDYKHSYAVDSSQHLARQHHVTFVNIGVSGATAKDVFDTQLAQAVKYKPDVVLLGVGANDARRFKSGKEIQTSVQQTIDGLKQANCSVRIVVTGAPDMGSVSRFIWPVKQLMGLRTRQVNKIFSPLVAKNNLTFAPIAAKTGPAFLADPTLFAVDKFHPNTRGYALWKPVITTALDEALAKPTPANCSKPNP